MEAENIWGCYVTVVGWRLRICGLSSGRFRLEAEDMGFLCDTFKLEAEDMRAVKWQF